jgi:hypothetical protein
MTHTPACLWLFGHLREKGWFSVVLIEQLFIDDRPPFEWMDVLDAAKSLAVSIKQDADEEWYWLSPAYFEVSHV